MGMKLVLLMTIAWGAIVVQSALLENGLKRGLLRHTVKSGSDNAAKRDALHFGMMIYRVTKRNPLAYNGYGCWCGIGGKGKPVDDVDRCCQVHDNCYSELRESKLCPFEKAVYAMPYKTTENKPTECKPPSHYVLWGQCRYRLCKCDADAARCFARSRYNQKYKKYPQEKC